MRLEGRMRRVVIVATVVTNAPCTMETGPSTSQSQAPPQPNRSESPLASVPPDIADWRVVFTREDGIYEADADGTNERRLIDLKRGFEYQPDWSPDGRWLALRVDEGRVGGTVLVSSNGDRIDYITRDLGMVGGSADWAPDSRRLVLTGTEGDEQPFGLYVIDVRERTATRITPLRYEAQYPAWSPDGATIAFTRVEPSTNSFDIWTINPDGSDATQLTNSPEAENYCAWSPDSTQLVYSLTDALWVMSADGTNPHQVTPGGEPQWEPRSFIVFDCPDEIDGRGQTCVVRPDGTDLRRLPLGDEAVFANWTPQHSA